MRKRTTFSIEGRDKEYEVKELSIREWVQLLGDGNLEELDLLSLLNRVRSGFTDIATNIKPKELMDFAPSEVDQVWEKFKEVNSVFFGLPDRLGVASLWDQIRPAVYGACGSYVVDWLRRVIVERPIMDLVSSSTRSTSTSRSSSNDSPSLPTRSESGPMPTKMAGGSSLEAAESKPKASRQP